jgi:hypothetical protein
VFLTDDLDGTNIPAGKGETITFALDGKTYEIDLTSKNGNALRKILKTYIEAGRPVRTSRGVRVKRTEVGADVRTIKEWARANGYEVNDRGRVPNEIRAAFEAAN